MRKLTIILVAVLFIAGCKKDKDEVLSIKGKWIGVNGIVNEFENDILVNSETSDLSSTTYDFKENGILDVTDSLDLESLPYTIELNSKIMVDGQLWDIINHSGTNATLSFRDVFSPTVYTEVIINMKR